MPSRCCNTLPKNVKPPEGLLKVELAAHGRFGDRANLVANAGQRRPLVDHFALDQRGVHVERDQAPIATEDGVVLERHIHIARISERRQTGADLVFVHGRGRTLRRGRELDAEAWLRIINRQRHAR